MGEEHPDAHPRCPPPPLAPVRGMKGARGTHCRRRASTFHMSTHAAALREGRPPRTTRGVQNTLTQNFQIFDIFHFFQFLRFAFLGYFSLRFSNRRCSPIIPHKNKFHIRLLYVTARIPSWNVPLSPNAMISEKVKCFLIFYFCCRAIFFDRKNSFLQKSDVSFFRSLIIGWGEGVAPRSFDVC